MGQERQYGRTWNLSNATRDAYRKEIREAKGKSWTSFCSDIEKGAEAARLNRLLARNPGAMLRTLRLPVGSYLESDEDILTLLTMAHCPGFKSPTEVGRVPKRADRCPLLN